MYTTQFLLKCSIPKKLMLFFFRLVRIRIFYHSTHTFEFLIFYIRFSAIFLIYETNLAAFYYVSYTTTKLE